MFKYALNLVFRRKLRTILTSLGVTIAVVLLSLILFGMQDLRRLITDQFSRQFSPNNIVISNSASFVSLGDSASDEDTNKKQTVLTPEVVKTISQNSNVVSVDPMIIISNMEVFIDEEKSKLSPAFVAGWDAKKNDNYFIDFYGQEESLAKGTTFVTKKLAEKYNVSPDSIIGKKLVLQVSQNSTFSSVKTKSTLNKRYEFTIAGVYNAGQDRLDAVISTDDALNIQTDLGGFSSKIEYLNTIGYDQATVEAQESKTKEVKEYLKNSFSFSNLITADDILKFFDQILSAFTIAMILFGIISALVASIGIINTMVMSIYEQTKEIGIIKSMGASNIQVLTIFLIQSAFIGFLGSLIGLSIVFAAMNLGDRFIVEALSKAGFTADTFFHFDLKITLLIMLGSSLVGVIAGIYPAFKAARLDPVKALKYE